MFRPKLTEKNCFYISRKKLSFLPLIIYVFATGEFFIRKTTNTTLNFDFPSFLIIAHERILEPPCSTTTTPQSPTGENNITHFVLLQKYNFFLSFAFFGEIFFFNHVSYQTVQEGAAHASLPRRDRRGGESFNVSARNGAVRFIVNNLFKEFLINDEMGNESEVKCRIFILIQKRDSRHSIVNHS